MNVQSVFDCSFDVWVPHSANRPEGVHLSDITSAIAPIMFPKWFKRYGEARTAREERHFLKGLVLEEAWGDSLSHMLTPRVFERPDPEREEGLWCSPDGYVGPHILKTVEEDWPKDYPDLVCPSIHEAKVTLKSSNEETSPLARLDNGVWVPNEKFITWIWQVKAYCYVWRCFTAYIYVLHLQGDYKERPFTPMPVVHRLDFTADELAGHWKWIIDQGKAQGVLE